MFDLGMMELLVIGIVALIVVGPKDLPVMFRKVGQFTGRMKGMAREFTRAMNDAADEAGAGDLKREMGNLKKMTSPKAMAMDKVSEATKDIMDWSPEGVAERTKGRGPETAKMTEERAENARKISEAAANAALARQEREAAEAAPAVEPKPEPATATATATAEPETKAS